MARGVRMSRYASQIALPQIGRAGQARLGAARVLIVGAGGLGVPVLQYLAGAGVGAGPGGQITLIDGDLVETGNLHRQPIYSALDCGRPKVEAARRAIAALNPEVRLWAAATWLDPANAPRLVAEADLVLDCADSFAVSLTLSDECAAAGRPLITASALGFSGYVAGCCGGAPSLRAIFPDLPRSAQSCAEAGIMGPVVAAIGALQAQMAMAVILGLEPSPLGRLISLDALAWRMGGFTFIGAPEPTAPLRFIAPSQILPGDVLVDLRAEAPEAFTDNALRLTEGEAARLRPGSGARVVLGCRTGLRAHRAGRALGEGWDGEIALMALR
ncbi:MAG: HesA/MoeB/ThiF family protein [Paracoccus sp. (in: a-proteobacteria)]|nr:HesA/MoeB/ThiF family protein [Paracoccus sp. (in: a-proteobacteria)]